MRRLSGEEDQDEANAAVAQVVVPEGDVTDEWLDSMMEPVTAFRMSRDADGTVAVALMRRPKAMCYPNTVVEVSVSVEDPTACVDEISDAGVDVINGFVQNPDRKLAYVVFTQTSQVSRSLS